MLCVVAAAGVIALPVAHADDNDTNYLNVLHSHGIGSHDGDQALISFGHNICDGLARGYSMDALEDVAETGESKDLSDADVKVIVKTAAATYCPQFIR